jgi:hypothetical protein
MKTKCYHDGFTFAIALLETNLRFFSLLLTFTSYMCHHDTQQNDTQHNYT